MKKKKVVPEVTPKKKKEVLETLFRFKFEFMDCKTFEDIHKRLEEVGEWFSGAEKLGATLRDLNDDYFFLEGTNPALKELGFQVMDDEEFEDEEVN